MRCSFTESCQAIVLVSDLSVRRPLLSTEPRPDVDVRVSRLDSPSARRGEMMALWRYFGRHSTLYAMMTCAGSALPMLFKSSNPLLSLAPASFKLPSSVDL